MLRQTNIRNKNIVIGILISISIYLEMAFLVLDANTFTVFLSMGVISGFYISFGKKVLPGIIISSLLARLVFGLFLFDTTLTHVILNSLSLFVYGLSILLVLDFLISKFDCRFPNSPIKVSRYTLAILITLILTSLLPAFQLSLFAETSFFSEMHSIIKPTAVGISVFTTTIILSNQYDEPFGVITKRIFSYILYAIGFTAITYFIFTNNSLLITFGIFEGIFLVLFLINGYFYSYRMLIFISIIYTIIHNYSIKDLDTLDKISKIAESNVFLSILIIMTLFFKI